MRLSNKNLALVVACAIGGMTAAHAQSTVDQLEPLVETSAHRIALAKQVALSKWDSGTAVEDAPREAQVIQGAINGGEAKGLDQVSVSNFFKAQIEANKLMQYSLLAEWHRLGKAPDHARVNLASTIRPELDQIQTALITELAATAAIRANASCHTDVAKAVGLYVSKHKDDFSPLEAIALDRAAAATCIP